MHILFLGYAVSEHEAATLSGASVAGNRMQLGLLKALTDDPQNATVDVLTILPVAPYPVEKKLYFSETQLNLGNARSASTVTFINIPLIKQFTQILGLARAASKLAKANRYDCILTYNMYPQVGVPAKLLARRFRLPIISLLADLPIDQEPHRDCPSKVLIGRFNAMTARLIRGCAGVIVLNRRAAELYAPNCEWLLMDGAVTALDAPPMKEAADTRGPRRLVFTGALTHYNGLLDLVEAMKLVQCDDVVLDIYGSGSLAESLRTESRRNPRINYHGFISSDEVDRIQRTAFLLINPRRVDDAISRVTFPSKILEYMLSGTPILSTRLNGFTEEYAGKMYFTDDGSAESIARAIDDLAKRPADELRQTAARAREFVLKERSWASRGPLVYRFLVEQVLEQPC